MPKVTLIAHTPFPAKTVAAAAKLCYSSAGIDELLTGLTDEKAADFVEMLSDLGHESPTEHASFTFGIEGVSRSFLAQITRHRIASYSVKSQRYVKEGSFEFVTPPEVAADEETLKLYEESMKAAQEAYDKITDILTAKHKEMFLAEGKDEKTAARMAQKKAIEDARFVLPNACETKMVVTMNTRSLLNFFRHRCCTRAQWEIRDVADQMLALVNGVAPELFKKAGPPCVAGPCPEGKMSCGRAKEMKEIYEELKNNG
ncbi:MAG: FAD-dependent thymidylate synthase [Clostridia bacterium]|nr:FAD-dependent thymidylate synthase [Clostridia bacterium]